MQHIGILAFAFALVFTSVVWMGARATGPVVDLPLPSSEAASSMQTPGTAHERSFDASGSVLIDKGPNNEEVAYILYYERSPRGRLVPATKRLVFKGAYACLAGDIPCTFDTRQPLPVSEGQEIRVIGTRVDDKVIVETLTSA